jgi:hypothetical protein
MVLGLVLAGLVGALVFMPFYISSDNAALTELTTSIINPQAKELPPLDLSAQTAAAARLHSAYNLDLSSTNRLFNPMEWQRTSDNTLVPVASRVGPQMVVITNITPLYMVLQFDSVTTNELGARYVIKVEKQGAAVAAKRRPVSRSVSLGDKPNEFFSLVQAKGNPENPDELVVKLVDTGEVVSFSHEKPFRRVEAYAADFRYDPERKTFRAKREGDKVSFNGTDFTVSDVKADELVLQDQSNQKKTPLRFTP